MTAPLDAVADAANAGAAPVRDAARFDEARLAAWLVQHVDGFRGPLVVDQFNGGQSNATYRLATPGRSVSITSTPRSSTIFAIEMIAGG